MNKKILLALPILISFLFGLVPADVFASQPTDNYWIGADIFQNNSVSSWSTSYRYSDCRNRTIRAELYQDNTDYNFTLNNIFRSSGTRLAWHSNSPTYGSFRHHFIGGTQNPPAISIGSSALPPGVTSVSMNPSSGNSTTNYPYNASVDIGEVFVTFSSTFNAADPAYGSTGVVLNGGRQYKTFSFVQVVENKVGIRPDNWSSYSLEFYCEIIPPNAAPPTPTLITPQNGAGVAGNWITGNPTFAARVSDPDGGNVTANFEFLQVAGNPVAPAPQTGTTVASSGAASCVVVNYPTPPSTACSRWTPGSTLADGKYDWRARATDGSLNSAWTGYWRVKKDSVVPTSSCGVVTQDSGTTTLRINRNTISGSDARSGVQRVELRRSTNGGVNWSTVATYNGGQSGEGYLSPLAPVPAADYTMTGVVGTQYIFQTIAFDGAGNQSVPTQCGNPYTPYQPPGFSISCSPCLAQINIPWGAPSGSASIPVTVTILNGTTQTITLSANSLNNGNGSISKSFSPSSFSCSAVCSGITMNITSTRLGTEPPIGADFKSYIFAIDGSSSSGSSANVGATLEVRLIPPVPWMQVTRGSFGSLSNAQADGPSKSEYLLATSGSSNWVSFSATKNWLLEGYELTHPVIYSDVSLDSTFTTARYNELKTKMAASTPFASPASDLSNLLNAKSTVSSSLSISGNYSNAIPAAVVFVDGDLNVTSNFTIDADKGVVFVVNGNMSVAPSVSRIDGIFVVRGQFNSSTASASCPPSFAPVDPTSLVINGGLYLTGDNCFNRDLGASNDTVAAETINYEPKYLWLFNELIGTNANIFSETNP